MSTYYCKYLLFGQIPRSSFWLLAPHWLVFQGLMEPHDPYLFPETFSCKKQREKMINTEKVLSRWRFYFYQEREKNEEHVSSRFRNHLYRTSYSYRRMWRTWSAAMVLKSWRKGALIDHLECGKENKWKKEAYDFIPEDFFPMINSSYLFRRQCYVKQLKDIFMEKIRFKMWPQLSCVQSIKFTIELCQR